jgi:hypothetical protein
MDGIRVIYLTGVDKHIKLAIIYVLGIILNQFSKYASYQVPSDNLGAFFFEFCSENLHTVIKSHRD